MTEGTPAPRWIEYLRLDDLAQRLDDRNAKGHDIDELRRSLGRFGYTAPIEVDERTGMLAAGHGRTELLLLEHASGDVELPEGLTVDDDGMWRAPVVRGWSSANDDEAEAYLVTSNRLVESGGWNLTALVASLQRIDATALGLEGVGYKPSELADLVATLGAVPDLDALQQQHGDTSPEDFWPTLRFKVSPDLKARYLALCEPIGANDSEHFAYLVELAEKGKANEA